MTTQYESLLLFCTENGRVCPQPMFWNKLYSKLPEKTRVGSRWNPPLPLILGAWEFASDEDKAERFKEHIDWAKDHNSLDVIDRFLRGLNEEEWHHSHE